MTTTNVAQAAGLLIGTVSAQTTAKLDSMVDEGFSQAMSRAAQGTGSREQSYGQTDTAAAVRKTNAGADGSGSARDTSAKAAEKESDASGKTKAQSEASDETRASDETGASDEAKASDEAQAARDGAGEKDAEAVAEVMGEALSEIKEAITDQLDISEEELETIMSELGLTQADLFDPQQMQAIAVAAAGETDELSILTDETLYQNVQQLTETVEGIVQDVQAQLQTDDQGFADILQQMESVETGETAEIELPDTAKTESPVIIIRQEETAQSVPQTQLQERLTKAETQDDGADEKALEELTGTDEEEPVEAVKKDNASETGKQSLGDKENGAQGQGGILQESGATNTDTLAEAATEQSMAGYDAADVENIMNQITEYMKVEVKAETTELEMQLQPESLGTLHIHLTAREGTVTAQFTAENEAVRAVLEAQAVQLKENLNDQGVKVEAVEVTVASHAFDRSFAENGENGSQYEEPKRRGVRRLQLDDDIPLDQMELSEEDRLAAEMMEQNGNTVDYTA